MYLWIISELTTAIKMDGVLYINEETGQQCFYFTYYCQLCERETWHFRIIGKDGFEWTCTEHSFVTKEDIRYDRIKTLVDRLNKLGRLPAGHRSETELEEIKKELESLEIELEHYNLTSIADAFVIRQINYKIHNLE